MSPPKLRDSRPTSGRDSKPRTSTVNRSSQNEGQGQRSSQPQTQSPEGSPPANQPTGDGKAPPKKNFEKSDFKADKMRVRLTPIEEFEKKLVFHLTEAPGRVVARLERLMGSDKVHLLDYNWIHELVVKLTEEERLGWKEKVAKRKKEERERYRQLAIDGYMEPTAEMQDIYNHPVYRVNKVIQRLNKFDYNALRSPKLKMPPLTLMDPFLYDDTGKVFKNFPGHEPVYFVNKEYDLDSDFSQSGWNSDQTSSHPEEETEEPEVEDDAVLLYSTPVDSDEEEGAEDEELEGGLEEETEGSREVKQVKATELTFNESLLTLQKRFGIEDKANLAVWEPFQSPLIDQFDTLDMDAEDAVEQMYSVAESIVSMYSQEVEEAEAAIAALKKSQSQAEPDDDDDTPVDLTFDPDAPDSFLKF